MGKELQKTGSPFLDAVRNRIVECYTPERIEKKVGEMWDAKDVKTDRNGEKYETPNWKAQEAALKTVLQLQGLEGQEGQQRAAPTNITIVVNGEKAVIKSEKVVEAVEVKEIKANEAGQDQ